MFCFATDRWDLMHACCRNNLVFHQLKINQCSKKNVTFQISCSFPSLKSCLETWQEYLKAVECNNAGLFILDLFKFHSKCSLASLECETLIPRIRSSAFYVLRLTTLLKAIQVPKILPIKSWQQEHFCCLQSGTT